jgi:hypothetical protein
LGFILEALQGQLRGGTGSSRRITRVMGCDEGEGRRGEERRGERERKRAESGECTKDDDAQETKEGKDEMVAVWIRGRENSAEV